MPRTNVTPFATYRKSTLSMYSRGTCPPGRWPCISASPGIRYLPAPSTRVAPAGTFTCPAGPTSTMRPSRTITVWFSITRSRSIGTTFTPTNATVPGCARAAPAAGDAAARAAPRWRHVGAASTTRASAATDTRNNGRERASGVLRTGRRSMRVCMAATPAKSGEPEGPVRIGSRAPPRHGSATRLRAQPGPRHARGRSKPACPRLWPRPHAGPRFAAVTRARPLRSEVGEPAGSALARVERPGPDSQDGRS